MTAITTGTWVLAALLAVAGVRKVHRPAAAGAALQGARLPADHRLVRFLGMYEIALGGAVLTAGGMPPAALLSATYAVFAVFVFFQARRGEDCGCLGSTAAPASWLHVAVNVAGAGVAGVAALGDATPLTSAVTSDPVRGVLAIALLVLATVAARLLLTALPELGVVTARVLQEGQA